MKGLLLKLKKKINKYLEEFTSFCIQFSEKYRFTEKQVFFMNPGFSYK